MENEMTASADNGNEQQNNSKQNTDGQFQRPGKFVISGVTRVTNFVANRFYPKTEMDFDAYKVRFSIRISDALASAAGKSSAVPSTEDGEEGDTTDVRDLFPKERLFITGEKAGWDDYSAYKAYGKEAYFDWWNFDDADKVDEWTKKNYKKPFGDMVFGYNLRAKYMGNAPLPEEKIRLLTLTVTKFKDVLEWQQARGGMQKSGEQPSQQSDSTSLALPSTITETFSAYVRCATIGGREFILDAVEITAGYYAAMSGCLRAMETYQINPNRWQMGRIEERAARREYHAPNIPKFIKELLSDIMVDNELLDAGEVDGSTPEKSEDKSEVSVRTVTRVVKPVKKAPSLSALLEKGIDYLPDIVDAFDPSTLTDKKLASLEKKRTKGDEHASDHQKFDKRAYAFEHEWRELYFLFPCDESDVFLFDHCIRSTIRGIENKCAAYSVAKRMEADPTQLERWRIYPKDKKRHDETKAVPRQGL